MNTPQDRIPEDESQRIHHVPLSEIESLPESSDDPIDPMQAHTNLNPMAPVNEPFDEEAVDAELARDGIEIAEEDVRSESAHEIVKEILD